MDEIAATQADAGLTAELFAAMAEVYRRLATSAAGSGRPEDLPATPVVGNLWPRDAGST
jgi:hypothetical protein